MSGQRILVVDDELHIRRLLHGTLTRASYEVIEAKTGREALELAASARPDAILLDLGLPDRDGLELVTLLLRQAKVPLLVVSARESTDDKVAALDLGADDYVTKPFDGEELLARLRAALRHKVSAQGSEPVVRAGNLRIDLPNRTISKGDVEVHLTRKEYDVLAQLAMAPGRVVTHARILKQVWPLEHDRRIEYLRIVVRNLRQKLEPDPARPRILINELGIGYRLMADP
ncbi:response regulator [Sphingomonas bacterium]|uniref:response regulator n=1 Tax=Sphingomonas bacterium TaxID=1895847 RepID=UPI001575FFD9|nr:response regulator transcription factor [Sphingomonas bacterium]